LLEVLDNMAALFVPADQSDGVKVLPSWVKLSSWRKRFESFAFTLNRDLRSEWMDSRMGPQKSGNVTGWIKHIDVGVTRE
jgi:hypothetical protein